MIGPKAPSLEKSLMVSMAEGKRVCDVGRRSGGMRRNRRRGESGCHMVSEEWELTVLFPYGVRRVSII